MSPEEEKAEATANAMKAFVTVGEYLASDEWHPQRMGDTHTYRAVFFGDNAQYHCYATIDVELSIFFFYVVAPVVVSEHARSVIADYITRANYGLRIGNFELDMSDGELRYKATIDFEGSELTTDMIKHAIYPSVSTIDRYMPGVMRIIYGGLSAEEAIEEIEAPPEDLS